jgi:uncharacterized membrane protein YjgN (DUF898 family)
LVHHVRVTQPPYAYPQQPYGPPAPNHPQATTALVLGILGLVVCGLVAPFAWSMGSKTVREIDASGGRWGGRSEANAGKLCGIVGTVMLAGGLLFFVFFLVFGAFVMDGVLTGFPSSNG